MKILVIDSHKIALDFCMRCTDVDHQVRLWLRPHTTGERPVSGDGIVTKMNQWKPSMEWADLIVVTDNFYYQDELAPYFDKGYPIFGCNRDAAQLELNREKGQEVLAARGIKVVPYQSFTSYDDAIAFVEKESRKVFVCKPCGDADRGLSYASKSAADMVFKLGCWKEEGKKCNILLQEFVPGIEMAVGGWFGPSGWSKWLCENFEEKKFMNDGLGGNVDEMGTVLRYVRESKLFDQVLEPMTDYLHTLDYVGYVDMNTIVAENGEPRPLEWTMRLGDPTWRLQTVLHQGDPASWMLELLRGNDTLKVSSDVAVGVNMVHGAYPHSSLVGAGKPVEGFPIYGITHDNIDQIHFKEVMDGKAPTILGGRVKEIPMILTAGDEVMLVTGTGKSVREAAKNAYDVADQIYWPSNKMMRTDIGCRLKDEIPKLQAHGFVDKLNY